MKRQFVAGVLGLALAGCAQSRSAVPKGAAAEPEPVGLAPIPSIHETINRGTGDAALSQTALKDPADPRWNGRARNPIASRSGPGNGANPAGAGPPAEAANPNDRPPTAVAERDASGPTEPVAGQGLPTAATQPNGMAGPAPAAATAPAAPPPAVAEAGAATAGAAVAGAAVAGAATQPIVPPAQGDAAQPPALAATAGPAPGAGSPADPTPALVPSLPTTIDRPGGPMPGMLPRAAAQPAQSGSGAADSGPMGGPSPDPNPAPAPLGPADAPATLPGPGPGPVVEASPALTDPGAVPPARDQAPVGSAAPATNPTGPLPSTQPISADPGASPAVAPTPPAEPAARPAPKLQSDPLLGPNPDLMPPLPPLPPLPDSQPAKPAAAPTATASDAPPPGAGATSGSPATGPSPAPASGSAGAAPSTPPAASSAPPLDAPPSTPAPGISPPPLEPVVDPGSLPELPPDAASPSAGNPPGNAGPPAGPAARNGTALPTGPPPAAALTPLPAVAAQSAGSTASPSPPQPAPARRDPQIIRTSVQKPAPDSDTHKHAWKQAGRAAARVGDEIITMHELTTAAKEQYRRIRPPQSRGEFQIEDQAQKHKEILILVRQTLDALIDRSLLVQEAKRELKSPQRYDKIMELADRMWREDQLLPMEARYAVDSEQQLRERITAEGRSLDDMHQSFRQDFLAQGYLHDKLKDRTKVELPDLLRYYNEHVQRHEFDHPAQITWRELVVEVGKYPRRDQARQKADSLRAQLRHGADFAQLARTQSDGPTSARNQGGLMQTSPEGYAVLAVNEALQVLPIGQVSEVLEGPNSFHIVRVENRRPAGPATFEEVQDQIRATLSDQRFQAERAAFLAKLRERTLITTIFDETENEVQKASR
ncbi:MAG TPA: peptidylprolyl isomerase [Isosphaeraceae bacterium]|nr:peptidylprolyl isomerase [Isosphaeraceae bacterium]